MFINSTLLKLNATVSVVTQPGLKFLCNDIKNGTSGKIQNREVGACYFKDHLKYSYAAEFNTLMTHELMSIVSKCKSERDQYKEDLFRKPSGIPDRNGRELNIKQAIESLRLMNEQNRLKGDNIFRISPYSVMIKITLQHFVPKIHYGKMIYPERYNENTYDYSSNQQVYEIRVPLVPYFDTEDMIETIFFHVKEFVDSLNPDRTFSRSRSTKQSFKDLLSDIEFEQLEKIVQTEKIDENVQNGNISKEYIQSVYEGILNEDYTNTNNEISNMESYEGELEDSDDNDLTDHYDGIEDATDDPDDPDDDSGSYSSVEF